MSWMLQNPGCRCNWRMRSILWVAWGILELCVFCMILSTCVDAFGWNWCNVVETIQSSILLAASNVAYNLGVPKISDFWFGSCLWFGGDNVPGANGLAEKRIKNLQATSDKIQLSSLSGWLNHELSDWHMPAIGSFASQKLTLAHNIDVCSAMNLVVLFWFIIS